METPNNAVHNQQQEELKRSIMEDRLSVLQPKVSVRIPPDTKVKDVINTMVEKRLDAVLIVENDQLIGIFSERDIVNRVALHLEEVKEKPIREFMTPNPEKLSINHTIAFALNKMDVGDYRHIPITDDENRPTGLIAVRDIIRYIDAKVLGGVKF